MPTTYTPPADLADPVLKFNQAREQVLILLGLNAQQREKLAKLYRALTYEKELSRLGIKVADVESRIIGGSLRQSENCIIKRFPVGGKPKLITSMDLRSRYAQHTFGVRTRDGKAHWFQEMLSLGQETESISVEPA